MYNSLSILVVFSSPECCYFLSRSEIQYGRLGLWLTHFQLLLKNGWRDLLQPCHKCFLWGPDQVLLLFKSIRNPVWPPWPLIDWHIFIFFSRMAEGIYSKLATNVSYEVPTKWCYVLSQSEIQYGRPGLWLADTFWTSSHERLKGSTPNLPQMFLMMS